MELEKWMADISEQLKNSQERIILLEIERRHSPRFRDIFAIFGIFAFLFWCLN